MHVHKDVALHPRVGAVDVETVIVAAAEDILDEVNNRARAVAAGEIHHVVITYWLAEKIPKENTVPTALDAARAVAKLELRGRGRKIAVADHERRAVHVD